VRRFAALDLLLGLELAALLGDRGLDQVDLVADVDAIGHGLFVAVVADHVFLEEAVGAVVGVAVRPIRLASK
jgi:hypothetical protein